MSVNCSFEIDFEEEVDLFGLVRKKLEEKKRKQKFWVDSLIISRREYGVFTPY